MKKDHNAQKFNRSFERSTGRKKAEKKAEMKAEMKKHTDLGQYTKAALKRHFTLVPMEVGKDGHLVRRGMTFDTKAWEIRGIGHLSVMRMKAFLGLMKMETIVIAPFEADLPLFNVDWVKAFGTETQITELYDVELEPWPASSQEVFEKISDRNGDLADYSSGPHWYDEILYPFSLHKKGKGLTDRFNKTAKACINAYVKELSEAEKCPADQKRERVRDFARKLVDHDGPAVNMMKKLFGEEQMKRIVLKHMYGVD